MKANHNGCSANERPDIAGYELSKIQNESESQHKCMVPANCNSWL